MAVKKFKVPSSIGSWATTAPAKSAAAKKASKVGAWPSMGNPLITAEGMFSMDDVPDQPFSYGNFETPNVPLAPLTQDPRTMPDWVPQPVESVNPNLPDSQQPRGHWEDVAQGHNERVKSGFHWEHPDYEALTAADPTYMGALASIQAGQNTAQRQRIAAVQRAITQFGGVPQGWQSGYGDVTGETTAAAQENPYSTLRTLLQARQQGSSSLAARLAARGVLSSGALTAGERGLQNTYEGSQATETNKLLDFLSGQENAWTTAYTGGEREKINQLGLAGERVRAANPAWQVDDYIDQWVNDQPTRRWVAD